MSESLRIQKFLSRAGVCSRRTAEAWMLQGRVKVNGEACRELGTQIDPEKDRVEVDGTLIESPSSFIYLLINKPPQVITSLEDPEGRAVITDLLPKAMPRVWPVGRLDWDSEGVLLLTNDGKLTNLLTHPSHSIPKSYAVKVRGLLEDTSELVGQLRSGVDIGDAEITQPAHAQVRGHTGKNTWLEVTIGEGRNRQIRRMFDAIGHPVMRLRRLSIGPLTIEGLASGTYRSLLSSEVYELYKELEETMPKEAQPSRRQQKREFEDVRAGRAKKTKRYDDAKRTQRGRRTRNKRSRQS